MFLICFFNNQMVDSVTDPFHVQPSPGRESAGDNGVADTSETFRIPGWSVLQACQDTAALFCQDFKGASQAIPTMIPIYI